MMKFSSSDANPMLIPSKELNKVYTIQHSKILTFECLHAIEIMQQNKLHLDLL
jgi:hypothetical protein